MAALSRDPASIVRLMLPIGAILMIGVGVYIYLAGDDELLGGLLALIGVIDLLTLPFVVRMVNRANESSSENPYAREE